MRHNYPSNWIGLLHLVLRQQAQGPGTSQSNLTKFRTLKVKNTFPTYLDRDSGGREILATYLGLHTVAQHCPHIPNQTVA